MSAPQIPNLNTFRRGGLRGKGRGVDRTADSTPRSKDTIVQSTDSDAAASRISAVEVGYLNDPFTKLITTAQVQRRLPLMNRGTYVRTIGIDRVVETFVASSFGRKQIISLGAGSDTRYFRLMQKHLNLDLIYHEIDFEANTKTKIDRIQDPAFVTAARELCSIDVSCFQVSGGNLKSSNYYVHARDLRDLPKSLDGVDDGLPTLIISECCLIYLTPDEADKVLTYFGNMFSAAPLAITIYEPVRPHDAFGKTMIRNLVSRGIHLQTLEKYADLDLQRKRLLDLDLDFRAQAEDVDFIWRKWVNDSEKERVDSLEWMDEIEEFVLLGKHYCISWGWKGWPNDNAWRQLAASKPAER